MPNNTLGRLAGAMLLGCIIGAGAHAQVPQRLNYQAFLTDSAGQPIDAAVGVTFSLYAVETGGVPLWTDTLVVVPSQGLLTTTLGDGGVPFPAGLFDTPLWVGIEVGADGEMTPRTALSATAYAQHSQDSDTLAGLTPLAYDQSGDVALLQGEVATAQAGVSQLTTDVAGAQSDIGVLQSDVGDANNDISQLQTDLATIAGDVTAVETTIPTLQPLVTGSCASGWSIRQVFSNGTVACEFDDVSRWGLLNNNLYYTAGSIGIGTTAPAAAIQIDAPAGVDPFRARVQSATKLRVHMNGSVSAGTSSAGPDNGLLVSGNALIGPGTSTARMTVTDPLWQAAFDNNDVGGDDWFFGSSATGWAIGGGKFVISPTASSSNSALVIDSAKDIGIGVTDPLTRLHLGGGSDVTPTGGGYLMLGGSTGANIALDSNEIMARSNGSAATLALNAEGGEVRINSSGSRDSDALEVRGRVYFDNGGNSGMRISATNSNPTNALLEPTAFEEALIGSSTGPFWRMYSREFYASSPLEYRTYSDRSLKQNVQPIENALAKVTALEGVAYELSTHPMGQRNRPLTEKEEFDRRNQLGFIAQDVEAVLPQMVREDKSSGLRSVGYMGLIPVLVEAIKEQQHQIDTQSREIDAQRKEINTLKRMVRGER